MKLLNPIETAAILGMSVDTLAVHRCRKTIDLPYVKVASSVRYLESDILDFIQRHTKA